MAPGNCNHRVCFGCFTCTARARSASLNLPVSAWRPTEEGGVGCVVGEARPLLNSPVPPAAPSHRTSSKWCCVRAPGVPQPELHQRKGSSGASPIFRVTTVARVRLNTRIHIHTLDACLCVSAVVLPSLARALVLNVHSLVCVVFCRHCSITAKPRLLQPLRHCPSVRSPSWEDSLIAHAVKLRPLVHQPRMKPIPNGN